MKPEGALSCLQEPNTGPCPGEVKCSPRLPTPFLSDPF